MKTKLLFSLFFSGGLTLFAQQFLPHRCLTNEYSQHLEEVQPGTLNSISSAFELNRDLIRSATYSKSGNEYIIPVVFHVVYNNQVQNLADSVILSQLQVLNEDYGGTNADSVNLRNQFFPYRGRARVKFVLATYDPDGNPTTGITRTQTSVESFSNNSMDPSFDDLERVKSSVDGGKDAWNTNKYLNIWVCNMAFTYNGITIPLLLGYAKPPINMSNWPVGSVPPIGDGVVLQYQTVGRNNPSSPVVFGTVSIEFYGRTATHEVGHYLGLRHIWGDGDCNMDDGITDTPNASASSETDCDKTKNTCTDNIGGLDLDDLVENFMDYAAEDCQNMFTAQQVELMRSVLENQRFDLTHDNVNSVTKMEYLTAQLYPNPVTDAFRLETSSAINGVVELVDVAGRVVKQSLVSGAHSVIQVSDLNGGVYTVNFEGRQITKFVKM